MIDKLNFEEIKPSSRRYPAIIFEQERIAGDQILNVENLSYKTDNQVLFQKISFNLIKSDKVVLFSKNSKATRAFYEILEGKVEADNGKFEWGITTKRAFLPSESDSYFKGNSSLIDWLRQYSKSDEEKEEVFIRGFLGKMLFSGDEALKDVSVLSGGEKVRCMLSKVMMEKANVLLINEPTNHLDLESITAFNNSLNNYKGTLVFSTSDHTFSQSLGNRIIELTPNGIIDRYSTFDEYMTDPKIKELRIKLYSI